MTLLTTSNNNNIDDISIEEITDLGQNKLLEKKSKLVNVNVAESLTISNPKYAKKHEQSDITPTFAKPSSIKLQNKNKKCPKKVRIIDPADEEKSIKVTNVIKRKSTAFQNESGLK